MSVKIGPHSVASLLLDEMNPRFVEGVNSQKEAINALLLEDPAKLINLAEDIVREDAVNPTELPVVVEEDGELVVIEGNRRLAALKLLRNPDLAHDPAHQKKLREITKAGVGPDDLICYLAESREAAKHWIDLRHTGENEGVGVVGWKPWQSNNFRRRRGTQADKATLFCRAVVNEFPDEKDLLADIETVRSERLTTLGRLIGDPDVRREYGFDFVDDDVVFHFDAGHLLEAFRKIFGDLAGEVGVSQIKSKEQRKEYIKSSVDVLPPRAERLNEPRSSGTNGGIGSESKLVVPSQATAAAPPQLRRTMPKAERVIFQGLSLNKVDLRTSKLLQQAQTIDIDSAPAVAAVMIRVIIELAVTDAATKQGWNVSESDKLKRKIGAAILAIDPEAKNSQLRDKALEPAWLRSQEDSGVIVQAMHAFVHNVMANPTAAEVRELSRTFEPYWKDWTSTLRRTRRLEIPKPSPVSRRQGTPCSIYCPASRSSSTAAALVRRTVRGRCRGGATVAG